MAIAQNRKEMFTLMTHPQLSTVMNDYLSTADVLTSQLICSDIQECVRHYIVAVCSDYLTACFSKTVNPEDGEGDLLSLSSSSKSMRRRMSTRETSYEISRIYEFFKSHENPEVRNEFPQLDSLVTDPGTQLHLEACEALLDAYGERDNFRSYRASIIPGKKLQDTWMYRHFEAKDLVAYLTFAESSMAEYPIQHREFIECILSLTAIYCKEPAAAILGQPETYWVSVLATLRGDQHLHKAFKFSKTWTVSLRGLSLQGGIAPRCPNPFGFVSRIDLQLPVQCVYIADGFLSGLQGSLRKLRVRSSTLQEIGKNFLKGSSIEKVDFSALSAVTSVKEGFMMGCEKLHRVDLSFLHRIDTIPQNFLLGCNRMEQVSFSPLTNVTTISNGVCYYCSSLKHVDLSGLEMVQTIGNCFLGYTPVRKVDLAPLKSLRSVGGHFMTHCAHLKADGIDLTPLAGVTAGAGFLGAYQHYALHKDTLKNIRLDRSEEVYPLAAPTGSPPAAF